MIVPEFWAEAKSRRRINRRYRTINRFGWSDISQQDAEENAKARVEDAFKDIAEGKTVQQRDWKLSYNGSEGVPIREEIISRHDDIVITRNVYGALCLNTPDVLFADVDFQESPKLSSLIYNLIMLFLFSTAYYLFLADSRALFIAIPIAWYVFRTIYLGTSYLRFNQHGGPYGLAVRKLEAFVQKNRGWMIRVYRTPAGLRALVMNQTFRSDEPIVKEFMEAIGTDPVYQNMCRNQKCFRARLTPKPWRIGVSNLRPRPGVWPLKEHWLPIREQWVREYERVSQAFAACEYVQTIGAGSIDSKTRYVQQIHDSLSNAESKRPIA